MTFTFFGIWQFRDFTVPYDWSYANHVVAMLCLVLMLGLVTWVVYLSLKYRTRMDSIPKKHQFIVGDESHIPFQIALRYIRKLLICIFLAVGFIEIQVIAMIAANFLVFSFYALYMPSKSKFNNWINILIELCYLGLEITLVIYINAFSIGTDAKLTYGNAMIAFSCMALIFITIWMIWQFLLFMYEFKFIRDIIDETKLANKIYPE